MPKRARSYWKGRLRLSLVSIPIEIFNAVESKAEISFRQIHKPSGRRVNYEKVVQGIGKIDSSDIVKGYEVGPDSYVTLEPDEIDAVKLESKKTIDLVQFSRCPFAGTSCGRCCRTAREWGTAGSQPCHSFLVRGKQPRHFQKCCGLKSIFVGLIRTVLSTKSLRFCAV